MAEKLSKTWILLCRAPFRMAIFLLLKNSLDLSGASDWRTKVGALCSHHLRCSAIADAWPNLCRLWLALREWLTGTSGNLRLIYLAVIVKFLFSKRQSCYLVLVSHISKDASDCPDIAESDETWSREAAKSFWKIETSLIARAFFFFLHFWTSWLVASILAFPVGFRDRPFSVSCPVSMNLKPFASLWDDVLPGLVTFLKLHCQKR